MVKHKMKLSKETNQSSESDSDVTQKMELEDR